MVISYILDSVMAIISKPTEQGTRTLVLAALTTPEENGKFYTNYQTEEEYQV
jgi:hypothetical protein